MRVFGLNESRLVFSKYFFNENKLIPTLHASDVWVWRDDIYFAATHGDGKTEA